MDLAEYNKDILDLQEFCKTQDQVELPLLHDFAPGVYGRRILMRKGTFVIGKTHKTEHFNIVLSGLARVAMNGETKVVQGGDVFVSKPGVKKILYILEDMVWMTIHPTDSTDFEELENETVLTETEELKLLTGEIKCLAELRKELRKELKKGLRSRAVKRRGNYYDLGNGSRRRGFFSRGFSLRPAASRRARGR